jgi:hypothetical protein
MRTRHLLLGLAACVALLVTGCAAPAGTAAPGSSTADQATPSSGTPTLGTTPSGKSTGRPDTSAGTTVTVTGTVMEGVEAKCLILRTDSASYQLVGGDPQVVHADARITVTGIIRTDLMSYCMQGIPLQVTSASPA